MIRDAGCPIPLLRVDGGASVSRVMMQFQADISQLVVDRPLITETTAFGAACLAGLALGVWPDLAALSAIRQTDQVFEPQMAEQERSGRRLAWHHCPNRDSARPDRSMMTSRVRPLIILSTAMLLLAVLLVLLPLRTLFSASSVSPAISGDRLPSVLLVTDNAGSVHLYTGLRQSLAAAGLASQLVILPQKTGDGMRINYGGGGFDTGAVRKGNLAAAEGGAFTSLSVQKSTDPGFIFCA
jgi:hypothetical protein